MVEVVGTAPTSAMFITKFVYRRSWKTNMNNIKLYFKDSIYLLEMALSEQQKKERSTAPGNRTPLVKSLVAKCNNTFFVFQFFSAHIRHTEERQTTCAGELSILLIFFT